MAKDATLDLLQRKFREKLNNDTKVVDLREIDPDLDEVWHFKAATGVQADHIIRKINAGDFFAAQVEAIFWRCYTEEGKRRFRQADKEQLLKLDPEFVSAISEKIGAFEDIAPDPEELKGNSSSTES